MFANVYSQCLQDILKVTSPVSILSQRRRRKFCITSLHICWSIKPIFLLIDLFSNPVLFSVCEHLFSPSRNHLGKKSANLDLGNVVAIHTMSFTRSLHFRLNICLSIHARRTVRILQKDTLSKPVYPPTPPQWMKLAFNQMAVICRC